MNQVSLKIGATLRSGTYRIDQVLGQGGFGITYLATDLSLDKHVAVKEFFPKDYCDRESSTSHVTLGTQSTSQFVQRLKDKFLKEAKNIAKFDHPNIIKIHAAFEENNTAYYVMDFIEGESLSGRVKRTGPLPRAEALAYISKVGQALEYVHAFRMNHLDVKPANIMVRSHDNCPILIDFGLSKQYDSKGQQTSTTPVGISHGYAPMEQYNDGGVREFSPATDEYSLAATLYYLLSGITPPQATRMIEDDLVFPESVPSDLVPPISKAMASARKSRYPTVGEFLSAVNITDDSTDDTYVTEHHDPPPGPRPTPNSPKRKWWIMVGCVALVFGVLAIWQPWGYTSAELIDNDIIVDNPVLPSEKKVSTVTNMFFHHSLGDCSYTGTVDENNLPHGKGIATWSSGNGKKYDGEWVHGVMEGKASYTLHTGDTFQGTFKADKYDKGRFTFKDTGEYFEGTYKNGDADKGTWYDKNGNVIE